MRSGTVPKSIENPRLDAAYCVPRSKLFRDAYFRRKGKQFEFSFKNSSRRAVYNNFYEFKSVNAAWIHFRRCRSKSRYFIAAIIFCVQNYLRMNKNMKVAQQINVLLLIIQRFWINHRNASVGGIKSE